MKRRLAITYFTLCFMLFGTIESLAYLDPSTSTYVIQIVAGGLIAGGTAIGIFFHKFKKTVVGKKDTHSVNNAESRQDIGAGKTLTAEDILAMSEAKAGK
ncbi:MAG: hypothetical protein K0Q87_5182 [Neobacillus sp.]|jgi:hypothetical protein|nr:hypothetical protein [Neobacillus sp.]